MFLYALIILFAGHTVALYGMEIEEVSMPNDGHCYKQTKSIATVSTRDDGALEVTMLPHNHGDNISIPLRFDKAGIACFIQNHYVFCRAYCLQEAINGIKTEKGFLKLQLDFERKPYEELIESGKRIVAPSFPVIQISAGDYPLSAYAMELAIIPPTTEPSLFLDTHKNSGNRARAQKNNKVLKPIV